MAKSAPYIRVNGQLYRKAFEAPQKLTKGKTKEEYIEEIIRALKNVYDAKGELHEAVHALERSKLFDRAVEESLFDDLAISLDSLPEVDNLKRAKEILEELKGVRAL